MKYFILTLTVVALLFNATAAQAMATFCEDATPPALEQQHEQHAKQQKDTPCHTEKADLEQTAKTDCCGDICLCLAKAVLKTIDAPAVLLAEAIAPLQNLIVGHKTSAYHADLFAENPPPKFFVA